MDAPEEVNSSVRSEMLMHAALGAYENFQAGSDANGLNQAISYLEASVAGADHQHPEMPMRLNNLLIMLKERHETTGQVADIVRAAEVAQVAADLLPTADPERPSWLGEVAILKWMLYRAKGDRGLLDEAISLLTELTRDATPDDPKLSGRLTNLSLALLARYRARTHPEDMDLAICHAKRAADLALEGTPGYSVKSSNLAVALMGRYEAYGDESDMDDAIAATKHAVESSGENDPNWLKYTVNLAGMLSQRYDRRGKSEDCDEAEATLQPAIEKMSMFHQSPAFATLLAISATLLGRKYELTSNLRWLNEAIKKRRQIIEALPAESPSLSKSRNNLAVGLLERHTSSGRNEDLKEAIGIFRDLADSEPSEGVEFPTILFNLSNCLNIEYEYYGKMRLLDDSIDYARRLANIASKRNQREPGRLAALAEKLTARHRRLRSNRDIEEALELLREELRSYPGNPKRVIWLADLAIAIEASSQDTEVDNDLGETIAMLEEEIQRTTNQPLLLPQALNTLGNRLALRFPKSDDLAHLNKAIRLGERAAELTPDNSPDVGTIKNNLGYSLELRYGKSKHEPDLMGAITCFVDAWQSESSISFHRIKAAGRGIRLLGLSGDAERGGELAKEVTDFLPTLSAGVQEFGDRMYAISTYSGIAADTCALLLTLGRELEALEYVQKGRAVILRELMDSRALSQVRKYDEELAERFDNLRSEVNAPLQRIDDRVIRARAVERRKEAMQELQSIIKNEIRNVPGLSQFQFDQSVDEMRKGAEHGPLIVVNISDLRSDAIIVTSMVVRALHLPQLEAQELRSLLSEQWNGLASQLAAGNQRYRRLLSWLWENGVKQIMAEVESLTSNMNGSLLRIRWVGSGLATSLPFHAAGDHGPGSTENVLSKAVSSYAPSIRFLSTRGTSSTANEPTPLDHVLIATMSHTPGYDALPNVQGEGGLVRDILGSQVTLGGPKDGLSVDQVKKQIQDCKIAHLACHGCVNPLDPSMSGLVFVKAGANGTAEQDILTLRQVAELNLQEAKIGFLSACSTATNKLVELTDESLTVVSGFQIAGFRHVIGALWPSFDDVCESVSETFYRSILDHGGLQWDDDQVIAGALHKAVLKIRTQYPRQPLLWAQFVHYGT